MSEVAHWLEEVDLEDYLTAFEELGVKKVKHLKDVEKQHLQNMHIKELEIVRFYKKKAETFGIKTEAEASTPTFSYISIPMPSPAFGHTVGSFSQENLKQTYNELWYKAPQNFKQRDNNTYILQMCSASAWRFNKKKDIITWAREEREDRWNCRISFANRSEVEMESQHFKKQCIPYQIHELKESYEDVVKLVDNKQCPDIPLTKRQRIQIMSTKVEELVGWAEKGVSKIQKKIQIVAGKNGRKEEENWWGNLLKMANEKKDSLIEFDASLKTLASMCREKYGPTQTEMGNIRKGKKNEKKGQKRKLARAEFKLKGGDTEVKKVRKMEDFGFETVSSVSKVKTEMKAGVYIWKSIRIDERNFNQIRL